MTRHWEPPRRLLRAINKTNLGNPKQQLDGSGTVANATQFARLGPGRAALSSCCRSVVDLSVDLSLGAQHNNSNNTNSRAGGVYSHNEHFSMQRKWELALRQCRDIRKKNRSALVGCARLEDTLHSAWMQRLCWFFPLLHTRCQMHSQITLLLIIWTLWSFQGFNETWKTCIEKVEAHKLYDSAL